MKLNKTIFYLFLGTSLALGTTSCSDYLDTEPITDQAVPLSDTPYTTAVRIPPGNYYGKYLLGGGYEI